jgi:hypothetical protein
MMKRMFKEAKMTKIRLISHLGSILGASVLIFATLVVSLQLAQAQTSQNCGMQLGGTVIFCEPFDVVNAGTPSRTGALDPNVWGVSRTVGLVNFSTGTINGWTAATTIMLCNGATQVVLPPNDVQICNGQLHEAMNDNPSGVFDDGNVQNLAMYPKQPFDFAGRTGTVSFDVSNDSHGNHSAWPEFWMTDLPVPGPFFFGGGWLAFPQNGFGVRLAAAIEGGNGQGLCPNANNLSLPRWTVDGSTVIRNYVYEDVNYQGLDDGTASAPGLKLTILDCVIASPDGSGIMNHVELRINQNEIDVYATDAGVAASPTTLRKIATITNANLTFTRGLIWIEDAHYNADKETLIQPGSTSQRDHTFVWDNVAFDGPFPGRDFTFDALDINNVDTTTNTTDLGQWSAPNQTTSWNVLGVPANPQGIPRVLFNFNNVLQPLPTVINVIVNGHAHSMPWPYPDTTQYTWRTIAVPIALTDLVAGTNVVQVGTDQYTIAANVNIQLAGVPGAVPVLPGNSRSYPPGGGSTRAAHDFNGDGKSDVAWRDGSGDVALWLMDGTTVLSSGGVAGVPTTWSVVGQHDFNGDSMADLLWRDTSGDTAMWFMNGTTVASTANVGNIPTNWTVVGVADFNGDGLGDILWTDGSGNYAVWLMSGATKLSSAGVGNVPTAWAVVGTGDFNGDGMADILWQDNLGDIAIWFMNGVTVTSSAGVGNIPIAWSVVGTGDFNGDGKSDIVWRDTVGDTAIWLMNGASVASGGLLGTIPTTFSIVQTGDYNGDGMSDLLWRDTSGNTFVWFMNGVTVSSPGIVGNIPTNWTVQSVNAE